MPAVCLKLGQARKEGRKRATHRWLACPAGTWPWTHSHRRWWMAVCHGVCWRAPSPSRPPETGRHALSSSPEFVSCHDPDYPEPLRWPGVPYQILGGPTENKVNYDQRNGIYIFFISIGWIHPTGEWVRPPRAWEPLGRQLGASRGSHVCGATFPPALGRS